MTTVTVVAEPEVLEGEIISAETIEPVAGAAVEIALIEGQTQVAIAEIAAETEIARIDAATERDIAWHEGELASLAEKNRLLTERAEVAETALALTLVSSALSDPNLIPEELIPEGTILETTSSTATEASSETQTEPLGESVENVEVAEVIVPPAPRKVPVNFL